jgi:alkanesulfonate monooxygenase SsuD/methylene tetrahydromethanopterin reductase-like flavin-dependent oxidoreductase (luciferase family)
METLGFRRVHGETDGPPAGFPATIGAAMKYGIFDYIDRRDEPLGRTFADRFTLIQAAEEAGFTGYHVTEHHVTPLSATPSPTVFLAAAARETRRIRLGTLLFLLPLYNPLRLIQELCMVDALSDGRLDVGVGRGISPHEFAAMGVAFDAAEEMFAEAFEVLRQGLTSDVLDHAGRHYTYSDVPMAMRPVQRPHPPFWYGIRTEGGHERPARYGMNAVTLGPTPSVAKAIARFKVAWRAHAGDPLRFASPVKDPLIGAVRAMFVADTDREAERIAWPAYKRWSESLEWLWARAGTASPISIPHDFADARGQGTLVVGSPDTVRRELTAQAGECRFNYLVLQLAFGSLTHAQEMRSLALFEAEVKPALDALATETMETVS